MSLVIVSFGARLDLCRALIETDLETVLGESAVVFADSFTSVGEPVRLYFPSGADRQSALLITHESR